MQINSEEKHYVSKFHYVAMHIVYGKTLNFLETICMSVLKGKP